MGNEAINRVLSELREKQTRSVSTAMLHETPQEGVLEKRSDVSPAQVVYEQQPRIEYVYPRPVIRQYKTPVNKNHESFCRNVIGDKLIRKGKPMPRVDKLNRMIW